MRNMTHDFFSVMDRYRDEVERDYEKKSERTRKLLEKALSDSEALMGSR